MLEWKLKSIEKSSRWTHFEGLPHLSAKHLALLILFNFSFQRKKNFFGRIRKNLFKKKKKWIIKNYNFVRKNHIFHSTHARHSWIVQFYAAFGLFTLQKYKQTTILMCHILRPMRNSDKYFIITIVDGIRAIWIVCMEPG